MRFKWLFSAKHRIEPTLREEISMEWSYWLSRTCRRLTGHRYGALEYDMGMCGRTCGLCGMFQSEVAPATFSTSSSTNYKLRIYP